MMVLPPVVNHLLTLVEEEDEFSPDLYVPGFSAFAELLLEEDKMNVSVSGQRHIMYHVFIFQMAIVFICLECLRHSISHCFVGLERVHQSDRGTTKGVSAERVQERNHFHQR